ncbi:hypothetical protein EGK75_09255 [Neisseria weixii]|uniref:Uncharacterized protein n=1 Tax=Neisseria weixii TaxID=1853276 RepID=A0A3N4NQ53_9NEIS|nr:hypothetical protein EGK75_09255 [Neisseria weixii]RPD89383.1 hypothetical protein EGK74_03965 [Neisseria weixii]
MILALQSLFAFKDRLHHHPYLRKTAFLPPSFPPLPVQTGLYRIHAAAQSKTLWQTDFSDSMRIHGVGLGRPS